MMNGHDDDDDDDGDDDDDDDDDHDDDDHDDHDEDGGGCGGLYRKKLFHIHSNRGTEIVSLQLKMFAKSMMVVVVVFEAVYRDHF